MNDGLEAIRFFLDGSHQLRNVVLDQLNDNELDFSAGGENKTMRGLFKDLGELQHMYTQSIVSGEHDWTYQLEGGGHVANLANLKAWFEQLDMELINIVDDLSPERLERQVHRTNKVTRSVEQQLLIYTQAMMIFLGKAVVYLRSMEKPLPPSLAHYIG